VMFHLDYISCFLTVLATILLARKSWIGLVVAIVNSLTVCVIGLQTSQLGFIPANLFCICVYAFSMRPWLKEQTHANRDQVRRQEPLVIALNNCFSNRAAVVTNTKSILSPEVNVCNKDRTSGVTPCVLS
jgi:type III secretory pathway component EscS